MKQLLDSIQHDFTIVALNDRVFVGRISSRESVYELVIDSSTRTVDKETATNAEPANDKTTENKAAAKKPVNPLQVQSVAISVVNESSLSLSKAPDHSLESNASKQLVCAVARYDKSLSLYVIDIYDGDTSFGCEIDASKCATPSIVKGIKASFLPVCVHQTPKRAACLTFAQVPGQDANSESLTVIIAGTMAGDAVAFSVTDALEKKETSSPNDIDDNDAAQSIVTKNSRLILGHTASMLTGIKVVRGAKDASWKVLTSDRDEKIRASSFPNTHQIEGFLLGHQAFVSSMDATSGLDVTYCISCSGDGTARLWDYTTCEELISVNLDRRFAADETQEAETGSNADNGNEVTAKDVPLRVAISPNGTRAAVIFDDSNRLDVFSVDGNNHDWPLRRCYSQECPSKALSIKFLTDNQTLVVLMSGSGESNFIQCYDLGTATESAMESKIAEIPGGMCDCINKDIRPSLSFDSLETFLLERDPRTGNIMVEKSTERRGNASIQPWNRTERVEVAKERNRRGNKRKRKRRYEQS